MSKKIRVAVLYGGKSGEHEVSLQSAASVIRHLDRERFEVIPVSIDKQGKWQWNDLKLIENAQGKALHYELVYWVLEPDFNLHMDIQQAFMLKVIRALEAEGIDFAYPTRKVFLEGTLREPKPANLDAERNLAEPRP